VDKLVEDIAVAGERLQAASAYRPSVDVLANGWAPAEAAMPEATPPEDR
jgi:hypothetical protein